MATNRNIQMNYYNGTDYDVLYPQSVIAQIENLQNILDSKLNLSGGLMTGNLTLNGDPSGNLQAVTKQYVDDNISKITTFPVKKESVSTTGTPSVLLPALMWDGTIKDITLTIDHSTWSGTVSSVYVYSFYNMIAIEVINNTTNKKYFTYKYTLTVPSGYKIRGLCVLTSDGSYDKVPKLNGNTYSFDVEVLEVGAQNTSTIFFGTDTAQGQYQEMPFPFTAIYIPSTF